MKKQHACPLASRRSGPAGRGSGLIFAVILLFVILGMVITLSSITVLETKMSQKTKSSVGAFYNSESGVEWALNKIANTAESNISGAFPGFASGKVACPSNFGCDVYFLDSDNKVIIADAPLSDVKAVRSVGNQNTGEITQRAIEAAVASGGSGCYVSYGKPPAANRAAAPNDNCSIGFTDKGSIGSWGVCAASFLSSGGYGGGSLGYWLPPAVNDCPVGSKTNGGEAYLCCQ